MFIWRKRILLTKQFARCTFTRIQSYGAVHGYWLLVTGSLLWGGSSSKKNQHNFHAFRFGIQDGSNVCALRSTLCEFRDADKHSISFVSRGLKTHVFHNLYDDADTLCIWAQSCYQAHGSFLSIISIYLMGSAVNRTRCSARIKIYADLQFFQKKCILFSILGSFFN